jgi:hypothetical protein
LGVFAKAAGRISFGIGGMEAGDFERVDVIHLPGDALSPKKKLVSERDREDQAQRAELGKTDDSDEPF